MGKDPKTGAGMLQFGTEVVADDAGTICGLLGASPGASTCVTIALDTIEKCFKDKPVFKAWAPKIAQMIPGWTADGPAGDLTGINPDSIYASTGATLKITPK